MHVRGTCSPAATQHRRTRSTDRSEDHYTEALSVGRGGNSERSKGKKSQSGKSISHVFARYSLNPRVGQAFPRCEDTFWRRRVEVESTIRLAKSRIAGFEGREGHRTPFASVSVNY